MAGMLTGSSGSPIFGGKSSSSSSSSSRGGIFNSGAGGSGAPLNASLTLFQKAFPMPKPIDVSKIPQITAPRINVPTITPAVVSTPANLDARIAQIFAPRYADLDLANSRAITAQQGSLAAAGLADSGVGIGAQAVTNEAFQRERTNLAGAQAGQQLDVEFQTLMANAANKQQANLTNAQLDVAAQTASVQAIMQGNMANAENYLRAIGLNADVANSYRNSFLSYFTEQQKVDMQTNAAKTAASTSYNTALLDAMLKAASLEIQASQGQQELRLKAAAGYAESGKIKGILGTERTPAEFTKPLEVLAKSNPFGATASPTLAATQRLFGNARTSIGGY